MSYPPQDMGCRKGSRAHVSSYLKASGWRSRMLRALGCWRSATSALLACVQTAANARYGTFPDAPNCDTSLVYEEVGDMPGLDLIRRGWLGAGRLWPGGRRW